MTLIPYLEPGDLVIIHAHGIGSSFPEQAVSLKPFGTLVAIAVSIGIVLAHQQAVRMGISRHRLWSFLFWILLGGALGGHVLDVVYYYPVLILDDPMILLRLGQGQSSMGGFLGATLAALAWGAIHHQPVLPLAEVTSSALPAAWVIGRLGCALAHDHPGIRSDAWFAVAYPGGSRLDLGLLEAVGTIPLAAAFLWSRRRRRICGFYAGWMAIYYAPMRFLLDFLRADDLASSDSRYLGLTPAQWHGPVLLVIGWCLLGAGSRRLAASGTPGA